VISPAHYEQGLDDTIVPLVCRGNVPVDEPMCPQLLDPSLGFLRWAVSTLRAVARLRMNSAAGGGWAENDGLLFGREPTGCHIGVRSMSRFSRLPKPSHRQAHGAFPSLGAA
jgi:hypothetical protein